MTSPIEKGSKADDSDQRYFPRWEVENDVYYHVADETHPRHGKTKDLNCAGVCITTSHTFQSDEKVRLSIQLAANKVLKTTGRVMWVRPAEADHNTIGILFDSLTDEEKDLIFDHAFEINPNEIVNRWFSGWDEE